MSPSISNLLIFPVCPCCAFLQIIDIGCQTLGERTACFHHQQSLSKTSDRKRIIHALEKKLMKCFTLFLSLLPLCSTPSCVVMYSSVLPGVAAGVGDLSSPCNTRLRLLLACLCCLGHTGASTPQQQVHMHESLSDALTKNIQ